ncbi:MAG: hypothetical protein AAGA38_06005 [Pseudomonadota bacterium]
MDFNVKGNNATKSEDIQKSHVGAQSGLMVQPDALISLDDRFPLEAVTLRKRSGPDRDLADLTTALRTQPPFGATPSDV